MEGRLSILNRDTETNKSVFGDKVVFEERVSELWVVGKL